MRIKAFPKILDLLKGNNVSLYNFKFQNFKNPYSKYDGDFALTKTYEHDTFCLLGLKNDEVYEKIINCVPNSWMASHRINSLVEFRKSSYLNKIIAIPLEMYDENSMYIL